MGFLDPFNEPVQQEGQSKGRREAIRKNVMVIINLIRLLSISHGRYDYMLPWRKGTTEYDIPSSLLHKLFYDPPRTHSSANFMSTTDRKSLIRKQDAGSDMLTFAERQQAS